MSRRVMIVMMLFAEIAVLVATCNLGRAADDNPANALLIRSARSGAWSDAATWEDGRVPAAGRFPMPFFCTSMSGMP